MRTQTGLMANDMLRQLADELRVKYEDLRRFYRAFDRTVDVEQLRQLTDYLLGLREERPTSLRYEPVPEGFNWRLSDLHSQNVNHLVWTIVSLCHFPCTIPFFASLRAVSSEKDGRSGHLLTEDELICFTSPRFSPVVTANMPLISKLCLGLAAQLFPQLPLGQAWVAIPIRLRGQVLGHVFLPGECLHRSAVAVSQWSYEPFAPFEDQTLEAICTDLLYQLRDTKLVPDGSPVFVLLYSSASDGYYLSGIRDAIGLAQPIMNEEALARIRSLLMKWMLPEGGQSISEQDVDEARRKMGQKTIMAPKSASEMIRLIGNAGRQVGMVQERMFEKALRQAVGAKSDMPSIQAIAGVLHICQTYQALLFWERNGDGDGYRLSFGYSYTGDGLAGGEGRRLVPIFAEPSAAVLNAVQPPRTYLPKGRLGEMTGPLFTQVSSQHREVLATVLPTSEKSTPMLIKSRLLIPLACPEESPRAGFLEIYFKEQYEILGPFVGEVSRLLSQALLLARDFKKEYEMKVEEGRAKATKATIHHLKTKLPNVLARLDTLTHDDLAPLTPLVRENLEDVRQRLREETNIVQAFYLTDRGQSATPALFVASELANTFEHWRQRLAEENSETPAFRLVPSVTLSVHPNMSCRTILERYAVVCQEIVVNLTKHADWRAEEKPSIRLAASGNSVALVSEHVATLRAFGRIEAAMADRSKPRMSGLYAIELLEEILNLPLWDCAVLNAEKRVVRFTYPVAQIGEGGNHYE